MFHGSPLGAGPMRTDKSEHSKREVETIIVVTGADLFDPHLKPEYGYGRYRNVITALEFERLVSSKEPTRGHLVRDPQVLWLLQSEIRNAKVRCGHV